MHSVLWLLSNDRLSASHNAVSLRKTPLVLGGRANSWSTPEDRRVRKNPDAKGTSFPPDRGPESRSKSFWRCCRIQNKPMFLLCLGPRLSWEAPITAEDSVMDVLIA